MKTLFVLPKMILLVLLYSNFSAHSQNLNAATDLTAPFLKETFENALVTVLEVKDDYIKTKDVFDFYIDIDPAKRFVSFSGNFLLVEGTPLPKILELMNRFNTEIIMVKSYYNASANSISVYYYFWTEGGFTKQSLLKSYKMMRLAVNLMLEKDTDKIMK